MASNYVISNFPHVHERRVSAVRVSVPAEVVLDICAQILPKRIIIVIMSEKSDGEQGPVGKQPVASAVSLTSEEAERNKKYFAALSCEEVRCLIRCIGIFSWNPDIRLSYGCCILLCTV